MGSPATDDRGALEAEVVSVVTAGVVAPDEFGDAFDKAEDVGKRSDLLVEDTFQSPALPDTGGKVGEKETPAPVVPSEPHGESLVSADKLEETAEQRFKTLQGMLKHEKETWEGERAQFLSEIEKLKLTIPTAIVPPVPAVNISEEILTDEQTRELGEYEQDFDKVSKMEGLKRSVELGRLRKEIADWKTEVANQIAAHAEQIVPVVKMAEESEQLAHFDMIREGYVLDDGTHIQGHVDFEKYRDDGSLLSWIQTKPKYLQSSLEQTYEKGSAADVIDLYSDFKRETNIPNQPPSGTPIDHNKRLRKQALATVTTRRGAVNMNVARVDDYEGAFDEALNR